MGFLFVQIFRRFGVDRLLLSVCVERMNAIRGGREVGMHSFFLDMHVHVCVCVCVFL